MAHYAKVEDGIVTQVIVADPEYFEVFKDTSPGLWLQTSYNTVGGVHYNANGVPDDGEALRYNYASVGYTYDHVKDAFIPPKPFASYVLNEETCLWEAPIKAPSDGLNYRWDEETTSWVEAAAE